MINIKNLNKFNNNDKGVSPVIGVILMVAATIVIAGVIMAMLGGFAPVEPPRSVAVAATHYNATHVTIVFHGGHDGWQVHGLNTTMRNATGVSRANMTGTPVPTGNSTIMSATPGPGNDHIVVVARFADGREQVVLDVRV